MKLCTFPVKNVPCRMILRISRLVSTFRMYLLLLSAFETKLERAGSSVTLITNTKLNEATGQNTIT
jgi:hypothetical protein